MIIYSVQDVTWDGIKHIKLFKSEAKAKAYARKLNRECGISNLYQVVKMEVEE